MVFAFPKIYAQKSTDPCGTTVFDCYQESGFRLNRDPVICMNTPTDPNLSARMQGYTESAVGEWSSALNAGSTSRIPKWNIQLMPIVSDICNVSIEYVPTPTPDDQVGNDPNILGVTQVKFSEHTALIRIFYGNANPQNDFLMIYAIRHEIGHAFGLGHYITSQDGSEPSIMIPYKSGVIYTSTISQIDIAQLESLYNNKGFGGNTQTTFPSIQSSTSQQISINTDKHVYYYGDHITITINVSRVTGANATLTLITRGSQTEGVPIPLSLFQLQTSITSPFALNETNSPTGTVDVTLSYDDQTANTSFQIIGQQPRITSQSGPESTILPNQEEPVVNDPKYDVFRNSLLSDIRNGYISDVNFGNSFFALGEDGLIHVNMYEKSNGSVIKPSWFNSVISLWAERKISDRDYASCIQFLYDSKLLQM